MHLERINTCNCIQFHRQKRRKLDVILDVLWESVHLRSVIVLMGIAVRMENVVQPNVRFFFWFSIFVLNVYSFLLRILSQTTKLYFHLIVIFRYMESIYYFIAFKRVSVMEYNLVKSFVD